MHETFIKCEKSSFILRTSYFSYNVKCNHENPVIEEDVNFRKHTVKNKKGQKSIRLIIHV